MTSTNKQCCEKCLNIFDDQKGHLIPRCVNAACECHKQLCYSTEDMGWEKEFKEYYQRTFRLGVLDCDRNPDQKEKQLSSLQQKNLELFQSFIRTQIAAAYQQGQQDMKVKAVAAVPKEFVPPIKFKTDFTTASYNLCREETLTALNALPVISKEKEV